MSVLRRARSPPHVDVGTRGYRTRALPSPPVMISLRLLLAMTELDDAVDFDMTAVPRAGELESPADAVDRP